MSRTSFLAVKESFVKEDNDYTFLQKKYEDATGVKLLDPFLLPVPISSKDLPTVSIIIPTWNAGETILACLTSIERSSFNLQYRERLQVVVVDDGSTDETWELL